MSVACEFHKGFCQAVVAAYAAFLGFECAYHAVHGEYASGTPRWAGIVAPLDRSPTSG